MGRWETLYGWLGHSALLSLLVLSVGAGAMLLCRQPTRRIRIIELSLFACLAAPLVGMIPGYPRLAIAWRQAEAVEREEARTLLPAEETTEQAFAPLFPQADAAYGELPETLPETGAAFSQSVPVSCRSGPLVQRSERGWNVGAWFVSLYLLGVTVGIAWWLVGMAALVRIVGTARLAPPRCRRLLAQIAGRRRTGVRVLASRLAKQPFVSVGMGLPRSLRRGRWNGAVIVLPESLCRDEQAVRWALAHEWTHIQRGDFRAVFVGGVARVLFFYQPLVWWLRRQIRLCQDYVADSRASSQSEQPEDYAEFLIVRAAAGALPPATVGLGMGFKGKSELYRRVVMVVENRSMESRPPRLWTLSVTCAALLLVAVAAALTLAPQPATGSDGGGRADAAVASDTPTAAEKDAPEADESAKTKITLESLGFTTSRSGPANDKETEKVIRDKNYEFLKTFEGGDGQTQYIYRLTYPDGRKVNRNFSLQLDGVTSWADYEKKEEQQRQQRRERISQALTAGRFRLLNIEMVQLHICRDTASGDTFEVQRIPRGDGSEVAFPRADFGAIPPSVRKTSWEDHLQAIRDGKRQLVRLETVSSYSYEMTADDGTKVVYTYGGASPLETLIERSLDSGPSSAEGDSVPAKHGRSERSHDARPQGNCSLSGKLVSESTGKPIAGASMYLFYTETFGSIFVNTDSEGAFAFKDIPKGPFSLRSNRKAGFQDAVYDPEGMSGPFAEFTLEDGEQRSGIVIKAKEACRVSGKIRDGKGNAPSNMRGMNVNAWVKAEDGKKYTLAEGVVKQDGSYVIDGLSSSPVYVMAKNRKAERDGDGELPVYAPSTFCRSEATLVTFDQSRQVDGVDIRLRKSGGLVLEGTVRDEKGQPVPEAFVVVHHCDLLFDRVTGYTDAQGRYTIQGLGDGEVLVHVDAIHRGFVRTRVPITLEKATPRAERDFVLHRGALISGKLVDQNGKEWRIGESHGRANTAGGEAEPEATGGWSGLANKFGVESVRGSSAVFYLPGEGDYGRSEMVFPTRSTFVFPSVKPGHTRISFSPQEEGKKVLKILHNGEDVLESGIETKPGQEIKDVTIVVGT